ncbi:MAG: hypothetical protein DMF66_13720 [Acidobacteria bacterium]|nr:MAG: hypothetical protein DMF66_13720 [Acidobacteriota bacterium]
MAPPPSAVSYSSASSISDVAVMPGPGPPPAPRLRTDFVTTPPAVSSTINRIIHVIHPPRRGLHAPAQPHTPDESRGLSELVPRG